MKKIIFIFTIVFLSLVCFLSFSHKKVEAKKASEPTCYQQNDPRWGSHVNGDGTIASSACGILSTVNCVNYLTGNFINPVELADYAHDIGAYNIPEGGGTWRFLLYKDLKPFEDKYGFTVDFVSSDGVTITDTRLVKHLKSGGVAIGYVPGHFIAIVGYNEDEQLYEIYDSAANLTKRHTEAKGTWLTIDELSKSGNPNMEVSWFCLISRKDIKFDTHYDGTNGIYTNGKDEADLTAYKGVGFKTTVPVSGYAFDSRGITDYYYTVDYLTYGPEYMYKLEPYRADKILIPQADFSDYQIVDERLTGFKGEINLENATLGMHYVQIYGKTLDGGLRSIASIRVNVVNANEGNDVIEISEKVTDITSVVNCPTFENEQLIKGIYTTEKYAYLKVTFAEYISELNIDLYYDGQYYSTGEWIDAASMIFRINPLISTNLLFISNYRLVPTSFKVFAGSEYAPFIDGTDGCLKLSGIDEDGKVTRTNCNHLAYIDFVDATCVEDGHNKCYCLNCSHIITNDVINKKGHIEKDIYYNDDQHYKMCSACHEFYDFENHEFEYGSNKVYHWLICECGLKKDVAEHVFDEETHLCKCGYLDPNLCYHEHTTVLPKVDPTYDEPGLTEGLICDDCGKIITAQTEIPVLEKTIVKKTGCSGCNCKKNALLLITELCISASIVYIVLRKKK